MALKIQDGGTLRTIETLYIRQSGINRRIRTLKVQDGGVLRTVAVFTSPLAVTASNVLGRENTDTVETAISTALPTGGLSPYTYAWTLTTNGGGAASTATSPVTAGCAFIKTGVPLNTTITDQWTVTVTDSVGATAQATINANFTYNEFAGGLS